MKDGTANRALRKALWWSVGSGVAAARWCWRRGWPRRTATIGAAAWGESPSARARVFRCYAADPQPPSPQSGLMSPRCEHTVTMNQETTS